MNFKGIDFAFGAGENEKINADIDLRPSALPNATQARGKSS